MNKTFNCKSNLNKHQGPSFSFNVEQTTKLKQRQIFTKSFKGIFYNQEKYPLSKSGTESTE